MGEHAKPRVYCSGPLFSPEERSMMALIARTLEAAGLETFLPQRDGLETAALRLARMPGAGSRVVAPVERRVRRAIFALDVFQLLERSDALVLNLNGRVPDEGAAVEGALAFAAGMPVILYKDDARSPFDGEDNPMLAGLSASFSTVGSMGALRSTVEQELARAAKRGRRTYRGAAMPPAVRDTVEHGRKVWRLLSAARRRAPGDRADAELLAGIAAEAEATRAS